MKASTKETKVRFYKKAAFPYSILAFIVTLSIGVVLGWTAYANQQSSIESQVNAAVASLKVEQK